MPFRPRVRGGLERHAGRDGVHPAAWPREDRSEHPDALVPPALPWAEAAPG